MPISRLHPLLLWTRRPELSNNFKDKRLATALRYGDDAPIPVVVAKGRGAQADRLIDLATQSGVQIIRDDHLALFLDFADIGDIIPFECYEAVAKAIAFVQHIEEK